MGKSGFLEKQRITNQAYFNAGLQSGRQQIIDMLSIVLHDPKYVKKDVFGKRRLLSVINGIGNYIDIFQKAWEKDDETDYYRAKLDAALAEIYGNKLHDSFDKRYEFCPEYDYRKGKWSK